MLKLKLQYFGHLIQRTDSFEETLMLGKVEGRRRRGQQRMKWLNGITDLMEMSLSKPVIALDGIDTTLVYTFDNAGVLLLSAVASAIFFKEKLSRSNVIGCIIMSLGLICMSQYQNIESFVAGLFA